MKRIILSLVFAAFPLSLFPQTQTQPCQELAFEQITGSVVNLDAAGDGSRCATLVKNKKEKKKRKKEKGKQAPASPEHLPIEPPAPWLYEQMQGNSLFAIHFPIKTDLSEMDYQDIQNQLMDIDIKPLLEKLYDDYKVQGNVSFDDFFWRCSQGLRQTLISTDEGLIPSKNLEKIGAGGNRCVVSYVSYNKNYPLLVMSLLQSLRDTGFNGYFYYQIGGFPNPTGKEIQYAATPYCFKVFTMIEAYQLGFTSVLWLDSAIQPLKNLDPLFEIIEEHGAFLFESGIASHNQYIFPSTRWLLKEITGVDIFRANYLGTFAFGLKMDSVLTQKLIQSYYEMASMGWPFLSCFPEEFVLTAIIGQDDFNSWKGHVANNKLTKKKHKYIIIFDPPDLTKEQNVFFYYRGHL